MDTMKITVLVDNNDGVGLKGEWGLSFYIEYKDQVVLLDAGLSTLFAKNAEKLGIDLGRVDMAVLSHAHDDHANGLEKFLSINDHAKLYVAEGCGENCYKKKWLFHEYIGIPRGIMSRHADRIVKAEPDLTIGGGIRLLGHTTPGLGKMGELDKMCLRQGFMKYIPDDFRHEQSLVFELDDGIVIFNSCSHGGADVIVSEAMAAYPGKRVVAMIGGFHLFNKDDDYVRAFAQRVGETGVEALYTGHCTGKKAMNILRSELGDKVHELRTGLVFEL